VDRESKFMLSHPANYEIERTCGFDVTKCDCFES
jgi:hypothetical protein